MLLLFRRSVLRGHNYTEAKAATDLSLCAGKPMNKRKVYQRTRVMHANTTHATCQRPNASREIKRGLPYAQKNFYLYILFIYFTLILYLIFF